MSANPIVIHPDYIYIVERKIGGWSIKKGKPFYQPIPTAVDLQNFELLYEISKQQLAIELFRINGGKAGYYLADLRHKKYYYCGLNFEDVRVILLRLGIGRVDPIQ
jgi:hypothetical protein